ncbi:DNA topoisomerase IB [Flavobacterium sp. SM2513]|uniref:DNA topoisomerase IB n=1 Tax=Flavobacterium sp. SM2513 TaxID=3424766 RepID=UPI003D7FDCB4
MRNLQNTLEKIGSDSKVTAKSVGLRYAGVSEKGFYRFKKRTKFIYKDENGTLINDDEILSRIAKLVIPPAWENVWISPYHNGHLQVTGNDAKGRKQYRYHEAWNKIRNQSKFYRLRNFAKALPKIRKQVDKDLSRRGLPYEKVVALVVKLIENTNIRIGNEAYKKLYGSFGLTTLRDKHVKFQGSEVTFTFKGKKGVHHDIHLKDRKLMHLVKKCKEVPGQELFQFYDDNGKHHSIGSSDVNAYLQEITKQDFTAKDFRVWAGSVHALCNFLDDEAPENPTQCKKKVIEVLDKVAQKLGNTRAVCKKYYVHPTVLAAAEKGSIWLYKGAKTVKHRNLNPEEKVLMHVLENEKIATVLG